MFAARRALVPLKYRSTSSSPRRATSRLCSRGMSDAAPIAPSSRSGSSEAESACAGADGAGAPARIVSVLVESTASSVTTASSPW